MVPESDEQLHSHRVHAGGDRSVQRAGVELHLQADCELSALPEGEIDVEWGSG